jgi:hypothetical protein
VISLIVALAQGTYAFAPAIFGAILASGFPGGAGDTVFFAVAAAVQVLAIACFWAGRFRASR